MYLTVSGSRLADAATYFSRRSVFDHMCRRCYCNTCTLRHGSTLEMRNFAWRARGVQCDDTRDDDAQPPTRHNRPPPARAPRIYGPWRFYRRYNKLAT